MRDLKVSLITVAYNAESTIGRCIESVIAQNAANLQYIIIDGGSTDGTLEVIARYKIHVSILVSEPDQGIYDAMNKGIALATGQVIGTLNADDFFAANDVLANVAEAFTKQNADILYGDLDYVDVADKVVRKWRSKNYWPGLFNFGWMPPHPTFYCKRKLFSKFGNYRLDYGSAADYELMLRFMHLNNLKAVYVKKVMIMMKIGGISNKSYGNRVKGSRFDLKAMRNNGILLPILTVMLKPARKMIQYF